MVTGVCVSRTQVSGHGVTVLRGLHEGPRLSTSVWEGAAKRRRERLARVSNTHPEGCSGAVADKQVPMLTVPFVLEPQQAAHTLSINPAELGVIATPDWRESKGNPLLHTHHWNLFARGQS